MIHFHSMQQHRGTVDNHQSDRSAPGGAAVCRVLGRLGIGPPHKVVFKGWSQHLAGGGCCH